MNGCLFYKKTFLKHYLQSECLCYYLPVLQRFLGQDVEDLVRRAYRNTKREFSSWRAAPETEKDGHLQGGNSGNYLLPFKSTVYPDYTPPPIISRTLTLMNLFYTYF